MRKREAEVEEEKEEERQINRSNWLIFKWQIYGFAHTTRRDAERENN